MRYSRSGPGLVDPGDDAGLAGSASTHVYIQYRLWHSRVVEPFVNILDVILNGLVFISILAAECSNPAEETQSRFPGTYERKRQRPEPEATRYET